MPWKFSARKFTTLIQVKHQSWKSTNPSSRWARNFSGSFHIQTMARILIWRPLVQCTLKRCCGVCLVTDWRVVGGQQHLQLVVYRQAVKRSYSLAFITSADLGTCMKYQLLLFTCLRRRLINSMLIRWRLKMISCLMIHVWGNTLVKTAAPVSPTECGWQQDSHNSAPTLTISRDLQQLVSCQCKRDCKAPYKCCTEASLYVSLQMSRVAFSHWCHARARWGFTLGSKGKCI